MILTFTESLLHASNCSMPFTLILKINSFNSQHPPFQMRKTEAQRLNNLHTVTKLESGRAGSLNPELMLLTTLLCCLSEEQVQRGKETGRKNMSCWSERKMACEGGAQGASTIEKNEVREAGRARLCRTSTATSLMYILIIFRDWAYSIILHSPVYLSVMGIQDSQVIYYHQTLFPI